MAPCLAASISSTQKSENDVSAERHRYAGNSGFRLIASHCRAKRVAYLETGIFRQFHANGGNARAIEHERFPVYAANLHDTIVAVYAEDTLFVAFSENSGAAPIKTDNLTVLSRDLQDKLKL